MDKRWSVEIGGVVSFVTPQNIVSFTDERDLSKGQIFYRRKISGPLNFVNPDFTLFQAIERVASRRCEKILIRLEFLCGGQWQEYWRGQFSTGSGSFDLSMCTFSVKPEVVDRYTCLLEREKVRVNILETPAQSVNAVVLPQGMEITYSNNLPLPAPQLEDQGWVQVDTQPLTQPAMGPVCTSPVNYNLGVWWRERIYTQCLNGNPVMPAGAGWIQLSACVDNQVLWARPPVVAWPFGDNALVVGPSAGPGVPLSPPVTPSCSNWFLADLFACPGGFRAGIYLCISDAESQTTFDTARDHEDVTNRILENTGCEFGGTVRSDFFDWDPVGDAPNYVPGLNYVTGQANVYDEVKWIQNSDAQDPTASNPATIGELNFEDLTRLWREAYRVYWDIDADNRVRVEHWTYWSQIVGLDLSNDPKAIEPLAYTHLNDAIPRIERAQWSAAVGPEFVGMDIVYSGPCASEEVDEITPGKFVTDISMVISDPGTISKDGFTLLATAYNGVDYDVIIAPGAITNAPVTNAPMAWSNLQRDLWLWDRFLPFAEMNGEEVEFPEYLPNIQQQGVSFPLCCEALSFDAKDRIRTQLGDLIGVNAFVETASFSLQNNLVSLNLRYPY